MIGAIAAERGCTPAQVLLAWHLQRGISTIPKSVTPARPRENLAAAAIELPQADLERIAALDRNTRLVNGSFRLLEGGPWTLQSLWDEPDRRCRMMLPVTLWWRHALPGLCLLERKGNHGLACARHGLLHPEAGRPRAMSLINTAVGLLAISSPIGVLPVVARAAGGDDTRLRQISRMAVLTFLFTLLAACWWGQALLDLFAITLDSFRVAGGLILLPIGLRLIEGLEVSHPDVETDSGSLGVVPIGLPLLAGPGAISLVVADSPPSWPGRLALSGVIILLAMAIYLILRVSMPLRRALGELQEKVISRLMGLLLSAIGVQMLVGGLKGCFPVLGTG